MSQLNDISLVAQVVVFKNTRAFDQLVKEYQSPIRRFFLNLTCGDSELSDDLAQDTFIKAYTNIASFRNLSSFSTWLYRIAVNTAKNYLVAQGRRPPSSDVDAIEAENFESGGALKEISNPENLMLSEELRQIVFRTIESLPEDLRMAITLRELDGLSYEEIAAIMDCPVGTVRSRIFRAREAIDNKVQPLIRR